MPHAPVVPVGVMADGAVAMNCPVPMNCPGPVRRVVTPVPRQMVPMPAPFCRMSHPVMPMNRSMRVRDSMARM
jgi:hypothetical protein